MKLDLNHDPDGNSLVVLPGWRETPLLERLYRCMVHFIVNTSDGARISWRSSRRDYHRDRNRTRHAHAPRGLGVLGVHLLDHTRWNHARSEIVDRFFRLASVLVGGFHRVWSSR